MRLFFYGTLGEGMDNPVINTIRPKLGPPRSATTRGQLYALADRDGWYPGLLADGNDAVRGILYQPGHDFTAADLARLDAYEAFDPADWAASEYLRREIAVSVGGEVLSAYAYLYNRSLPAGSRRIDHGSFPAFLADNGYRALAPRDP